MLFSSKNTSTYIFTLGIVFIMYKNPTMLKNLMNANQQNSSPPHSTEDEEEPDQNTMNGDL